MVNVIWTGQKKIEAGYKKAALKNYVNGLEGKLLLIHGTSDDVVVMQHNLSLVQAFVEAGKQMDFFLTQCTSITYVEKIEFI